MGRFGIIGLAALIAAGAAGGQFSGIVPGFGRSGPETPWAHNRSVTEDLASIREKASFQAVNTGNSSTSADRRAASFLDDAVDRLSDGSSKNARAELRRIAAERRDLQEELDKARMDAASDPSGLPGIESKEVSGIEAKLQALDGEAAAAKSDLVASLRKDGIDLTDQQIDGLLALATSDSFADMVAAFANLKSIDAELLRATEASGESIAVAKRYYGLHATLTEEAAWLQWKFIQSIDADLMPKLDAISAEASSLKADAIRLKSQSDSEASALDANIAAQDLTIRTASLYKDALRRQRDAMQSAFQRTSRQLEVSVNTWKTVKVSADLVSMMRTNEGTFRQLLEISLPDLRPFENVELKNEFQRISDRLATPVS